MNSPSDSPAPHRALTYECPHCHQSVQVDAALVGQAVNCPECQQPFKLDPPSGRFVSATAEGRGSVHAETPGGEQTLITTHPSMFGISPLKFLILWLSFLAGVGLCFVNFIIGIAIAVLSGLWLLVWWIDAKFQELTVTNERTIYRRGILSTRSSEVQHDDVRNMQVNQSIFQRMIGVGDIAISSAGQSDMEIQVSGFKNPNDVIELIRRYQ